MELIHNVLFRTNQPKIALSTTQVLCFLRKEGENAVMKVFLPVSQNKCFLK